MKRRPVLFLLLAVLCQQVRRYSVTEDEKCLRNMAHEFEEGFNSGAEYTEKGKPGKDEGRYVTIWKHQKDGSWKLSMDMGVPQE